MSDVKNYKKFRGGIRLETQSSDPSSNLEEGAVVYNSTEKSLKVHNGAGFAAVGGGSGGSLDTFYTEDFTTTPKTDFTATTVSINDLSIETSSPIDSKSLKFQQSGTIAGTILHTAGIVPTLKQKGNTCSIAFWYTYDGNDDDIKVLVKSTDGSASVTTISAGTDLLKTATTTKKFTTTFTIPSDSAKIQWGFEIVTGDSNKILLIDDVEMSQDPFVQSNLGSTNPHIITPAKSNLTDWQSYTATLNNDTNVVTGYPEAKYRRVGDSIEVKFNVKWDGTGHASTFSLSLPPGLTFDDAKLPDNVYQGTGYMGSALWYDDNVSTKYSDLIILRGSSTTIQIGGDYPDGQSTGTWYSSSAENNDYLSGTFTAPITGWSAQDSNFLAALPMTQWKRKHLVTSISGTAANALLQTTTDNSAFKFQNLPEGTYKVSGQFNVTNDGSSSADAYIEVKKGSTNLLKVFSNKPTSIGEIKYSISFSEVFVVTSGDVSGGTNIVQCEGKAFESSDAITAGDQESFIILEKLHMHEDAGTIWD